MNAGIIASFVRVLRKVTPGAREGGGGGRRRRGREGGGREGGSVQALKSKRGPGVASKKQTLFS